MVKQGVFKMHINSEFIRRMRLFFILKQLYIRQQMNKKEYQKHLAREGWRKRNQHNYTEIEGILDTSSISVGNYTYGTINVLMGEKSN